MIPAKEEVRRILQQLPDDKDGEMARTVRWTEAATEDLSEMVQFIARDAPFYAAALVGQARAAALSLRNSPRRGRIVPESGDPDIREIFLKAFVSSIKLPTTAFSSGEILHNLGEVGRVAAIRGKEPFNGGEKEGAIAKGGLKQPELMQRFVCGITCQVKYEVDRLTTCEHGTALLYPGGNAEGLWRGRYI